MFSIPEGIADNIRGCRFAQPPATFCNPYRGNLVLMYDNEVVNLLKDQVVSPTARHRAPKLSVGFTSIGSYKRPGRGQRLRLLGSFQLCAPPR